MPVAATVLRQPPPSVQLSALRTQLQAVVTGRRAAGSPWATGIGPLDTALGGGIPRGRITEVVGTRSGGKTALLRQVIAGALRAGGWVAWIDARRTLAAAPWATLGERLVIIRPRDGQRSAWCADLLLRSGVFALVVIDGAPALSRVHGVRLAQLARERDAACVVLHHEDRPSRVSGAVRLRLERITHRRSCAEVSSAQRAFSVVVEKGGELSRSIRSFEVNSDIVMARRMCTDSEIPDRRGVARSTRRPWAAVGGSADDAMGHPITWGGLSVSASNDIYNGKRETGDERRGTGGSATDDIYTARPHANTDRDTTRAGVVRTGEHTGETERRKTGDGRRPTERGRDRERLDRGFETHTRDWTRYRGRRRAAESSYGKPSRRERAREAIGAVGTQYGVRVPSASPALGRVAEGTRR